MKTFVQNKNKSQVASKINAMVKFSERESVIPIVFLSEEWRRKRNETNIYCGDFVLVYVLFSPDNNTSPIVCVVIPQKLDW